MTNPFAQASQVSSAVWRCLATAFSIVAGGGLVWFGYREAAHFGPGIFPTFCCLTGIALIVGALWHMSPKVAEIALEFLFDCLML